MPARRHVAIAGGGIGGLTTALALAAAGCRVTVYERSATPGETGAGLQLPPNATTVLRALGVLPAIQERATTPEAVLIRRGRDGRLLAKMPLGDAAVARYGAPFLLIWRAELHRVLLDAAEASPSIAVAPGSTVTAWRADAAPIDVTLEGATPGGVRVDALVGADGLRSTVRRQLWGEAITLAPSRRTAWRATIPRQRVPDGFLEPNSNLWLGRHAHLVHYPVSAGSAVNVVAVVAEAERGRRETDGWSSPGCSADLACRFEDWTPPVQALLASAPDWRTWPLLDLPPLPRWSRGPVTLLGDAAHPMLPFLAQGAAQAIEDAEALARCWRLSPDDPSAAFQAYEAERRPRTARVQRQSRRQGLVYHLAWPASLARDLAMGATPPARLVATYDWLYGRDI